MTWPGIPTWKKRVKRKGLRGEERREGGKEEWKKETVDGREGERRNEGQKERKINE